MPRVVGRGSELDDEGRIAHDFLVFYPRRARPRRKEKYVWKTMVEMQDDGELESAFEILPPQRRGTDPTGRHWVETIDDARGPPSAREYRTMFFTWKTNVALRRVWQSYERFVDTLGTRRGMVLFRIGELRLSRARAA